MRRRSWTCETRTRNGEDIIRRSLRRMQNGSLGTHRVRSKKCVRSSVTSRRAPRRIDVPDVNFRGANAAPRVHFAHTESHLAEALQ